jgi:hypothetical protein
MKSLTNQVAAGEAAESLDDVFSAELASPAG